MVARVGLVESLEAAEGAEECLSLPLVAQAVQADAVKSGFGLIR
jgi:hypothetical protein